MVTDVESSDLTASQFLAAYAIGLNPDTLPADLLETAKLALLDFIACALEARDLPWSRQALAVARTGAGGPAAIIGTADRASPPEAAFANATMGHGLVREDMHPGSNSHLGVVVWPTLLALISQRHVRGRDLLAAAVAGYDVGARIGRTLFDAELARRIRPTGVTGPIGAAAAGARLLGLDRAGVATSIAIAANMAAGLNNWPWAGSTEVFFHAGAAARSAVTAALLAQAGASGSPSALDGPGGLYDAHQRREHAASLVAAQDTPFALQEIYFKPAPACNYVQTACQAALALSRAGVRAGDVAAVTVATVPAATQYPGCDFSGPFEHLLQAKMSIQFSVATTLVNGALHEAAFAQRDDPEIQRIARATTLSHDAEFTAAFPSRQGAEVTVTLRNGATQTHRQDDVHPCPPAELRSRFHAAAVAAFGEAWASDLEGFVMRLDSVGDARALTQLLSAPAGGKKEH
jgi:2-methylcitrate dehydratase PrpD